MPDSIVISEPSPEEAAACFNLVKRVFDACVAPDYCEQGVAFYYSFITPQYVENWRNGNRICYVARDGKSIVGIIDVRDGFHITMFFVDVGHQKQGIGRALLDRALAECRRKNPSLGMLEVHSSPFAVGIYEQLGFEKKDVEREVNGIRFTRMELNPRKE
jgi:GNAT superfamily N-acetyltransferase